MASRGVIPLRVSPGVVPIPVGFPPLPLWREEGRHSVGFGWWLSCPSSVMLFQLPRHPRLSQECRDLLQRLLKRDPQQRISFKEFFAHPFVDMEHMPSAESLGKAVSGSGPRGDHWGEGDVELLSPEKWLLG